MEIIDKYKSPNFFNRIVKRKLAKSFHEVPNELRTIIIHYTASTNLMSSLYGFLSKGNLSANYIIDIDGRIYRLVPEEKAAIHVGGGVWMGNRNTNSGSIGIELVNPGFTIGKVRWPFDHVAVKESNVFWYKFSEKQIESLIYLLSDLKNRYKIKDKNILGHSDLLASCRKIKTDPGPIFPWKYLSEQGIGVHFDSENFPKDEIDKVDIQKLQKRLVNFGYTDCPVNGKLDRITSSVITLFCWHFCSPKIIENTIDCNYNPNIGFPVGNLRKIDLSFVFNLLGKFL